MDNKKQPVLQKYFKSAAWTAGHKAFPEMYLYGMCNRCGLQGFSKGAIWRTVAAAFFLAFMSNGFNLNQIDPLWQRIILGLVIVIAVAIDSWSQRKNV